MHVNEHRKVLGVLGHHGDADGNPYETRLRTRDALTLGDGVRGDRVVLRKPAQPHPILTNMPVL